MVADSLARECTKRDVGERRRVVIVARLAERQGGLLDQLLGRHPAVRGRPAGLVSGQPEIVAPELIAVQLVVGHAVSPPVVIWYGCAKVCDPGGCDGYAGAAPGCQTVV